MTMISRIRKFFGFKTKAEHFEEELIKLKEPIPKQWVLKKDGLVVGEYKNPSRVAAAHEDLHRSKLYYHVNKYGTFKNEKYELTYE